FAKQVGKALQHTFGIPLHGPAQNGAELFDAQVLGERVDGEDFGPTLVLQIVGGVSLRHAHLPVVAGPLRLAGETDLLAVAEFPRHPRLVEPDAFEVVLAAVAQNDAEDLQAVAGLLALNLHDLTSDGLNLVLDQLVDLFQSAELFIAARKMP